MSPHSLLSVPRFARALAIAGLLAAATVHAQPVELFSPQGEVKGVRQVTARFAQPKVAFGDPRGQEPFAIDCAEKGTGRWADTKNWVYDFARDLPAGVRCAFTVKPGIVDAAGKPVAAGGECEALAAFDGLACRVSEP